MKKRLLNVCAAMLMVLSAMAQNVDPNFHIYLCFGQSNMQGKGKIEAKDKADVPERFKMMATVDFPSLNRKAGEWYTAVPPLCRPETGLGVTDYFGRQMVESLPDSISVGVINVAVDGCSIQMFDEDVCKSYIVGQPDYMTSAAKAYDNNPFRHLVNLAKEAQKVGVIKGILLHQGETDMDNNQWNIYVHRIYNRMLGELGLNSNEVPLIAGEALRQVNGGVCEKQRTQVAKLPLAIENCMIVTSENCTNTDQYHFSSEGYRTMGRRYAKQMLGYLEGYEKQFAQEMTSLRLEGEAVQMTVAGSKKLHLVATDAEGKEYNVTSACSYSIEEPELLGVEGTALVSAQQPGNTRVTATLVNPSGTELNVTFDVAITLFDQSDATFRPGIYQGGKITSTPNSDFTFKGTTGGFGGWVYNNYLDLSATPYLMLDFAVRPPKNSRLVICEERDFYGLRFEKLIDTSLSPVIDLRELTNKNKKALDVSHIYMVGFLLGNTPTLYIKSVQLSADGVTPVGILPISNASAAPVYYDLQGRRVMAPSRGLYVKDGKKVVR